MSDSILHTENLTKRYGAKAAVDHVSLDIHPGDVYGFIGLNGAGKTTFIRMLTGLAAPDEGVIELFGERTPEGLSRSRGKTGCVVETPAFYNYMTARQNLEIQCMLSGTDPRSRIPEVLEAVGLEPNLNRKVKYYSLGMRQRLGLARALVSRPALLILDEPINGLDPAGIYAFREYVRDLVKRDGMTVLISSHILSELSLLATRYGIIHEGKLIDEVHGSDLSAIQEKTALLRTADSARAADILRGSGLVTPEDITVDDAGDLRVIGAGDRTGILCRTVVEGGVDVLSLGTTEYTLEEHFMRMTGGGQDA